MKRNWQPEELLEYWTLLPKELELLAHKNPQNRLIFALLLKFFQMEAKFPESDHEIPAVVVNYVTQQLSITPSVYQDCNWQGRSVKYYRKKIRELFGFREATINDAEELVNWLTEQALIYELKFEQLESAAFDRLRELKIEPPTLNRLERITHLMTEWHIRYGGRGVMIYWHVEKNSVCIYSQLKTCSSSEVAAMIQGLLRHCTQMKVEKNFVDSHGQSEVAFAFCHLLGFQLMPRIKRINVQKLYLPINGSASDYPNLQPVLTRTINWDLIRQQYDQMIKYATALRLGMAETDAILKRFTRGNLLHPTYQALCELGKAVKTIFLCQYLHSVELRREINEGLNVVENWNSANSFIFYGKGGEVATNRLEDQELAILSLHLLQISLVYINTLMIQQVLSQPEWMKLMTKLDLRALSPLIWLHINPYGTFKLDMNERLPIETAA